MTQVARVTYHGIIPQCGDSGVLTVPSTADDVYEFMTR